MKKHLNELKAVKNSFKSMAKILCLQVLANARDVHMIAFICLFVEMAPDEEKTTGNLSLKDHFDDDVPEFHEANSNFHFSGVSFK